jgi:subtilisin family serine protease
MALAAAAASLAFVSPRGGAETARPQAFAVGYTTRAALAQALHGRAAAVRSLPALHVVELRAPAGLARDLRSRPGIRYVEPVSRRAAAADPALSSASGAAYEWQFAATHENAVPQAVLRAAANVTIAVVDTGADVTAPDIAAKAPVTWSAVADSPDVRDTNGHGTFVADLAAGSVTNNDGIAGFGGDAKLMIVQANRGGESFTDLDEANAIVWAVDHGAQIVNLSIGGSTTSRTERSAIDYAAQHGVLLVAAAGNEYQRGNPVEYPGALIQPPGSNGVGGRGLVVGASTESGGRAPFSNTGGYVSLVAPGVDVVSGVSSLASQTEYPRITLPGAVAGLYGIGSGTSYATPQVSGAAALVWAANPALTAAQVAQILKETASNRGSWNPQTGWGVLDVAAAVARATGAPLPAVAASVRLSGSRTGRRVRLSWAGRGAARYRLAVAEDGRPARTLLSGTSTTAAYSLVPGHVYVFTVDAVDDAGSRVATSSPYRVDVAPSPVQKRLAARPRRQV